MKDEHFQRSSAKDALFIDRNTSVDDVKQFIQRRIENPIVIDETVIWDFCGYQRDRQALEEAVDIKLQSDRYIIPFQVTGTWGFMYHLLPQELKDAEILVYDPQREIYKGYKNFAEAMSVEQQKSFRQDLAKRVADSEAYS